MQNIHAHVWDPEAHLSPSIRQHAQRAAGRAMDLSTSADALVADSAPFDRVVLFGLRAAHTGFAVPDDYVAQMVKLDPARFVGFAACDPTAPGAMDRLVRAIEQLHLGGVKMGPAYGGYDPRDPRCEPIYTYCESHGLPILFHAGTTFLPNAPLQFSRPWLWDEVAARHPNLRMVLAHLGHPFQDECIAVIRKHPQVYADISALYYRPWQFYNMMILAQEYNATGKLLFGTDYPFAASRDSIEGVRNVNRVTGNSGLPQVSAEVVEQILARDALGLLGVQP
jgi:predicted TIM-barrel fold metal-dependent hydrolase